MAFELNLQSKIVRLTFAGIAAFAGIFLLKIIFTDFIITTFADRRLPVTRKMLEDAVNYFPPSPRINHRLAEFEALGNSEDLNLAETHISAAIRRSPRDFRMQMLLGDISDNLQKQSQAETAYRAALALAPNYSEIHWKLANLLLRSGKQAEAYGFFRSASQLNRGYLPTSLDLVWKTSGKNLREAEKLTAGYPAAQLNLVNLYAAEGKLPEAIEIFSGIDKTSAIKSGETAKFIDLLQKSGYPKAARELWQDLAEKAVPDAPVEYQPIWNPGFEYSTLEAKADSVLHKFDWQFSTTDYARAGIETKTGHTGGKSLMIEFAGRDTTKLTNEVRQRLVLEPNARYRLSFFAVAENLMTPEGPKVAIMSEKGEMLAASDPISEKLRDWTKMSFEFTAPKTASGDGVIVILTVSRKPRYAYDEPTKGIVRIDDFSLARL